MSEGKARGGGTRSVVSKDLNSLQEVIKALGGARKVAEPLLELGLDFGQELQPTLLEHTASPTRVALTRRNTQRGGGATCCW